MNRYCVAVARFPYGGWERKECVAWLINAVGQMRRDPRISGVESLCYDDTPITMCRNRAVVEARRLGADYLLMVDSDMAPDAIGPRPFWPVAWEFMLSLRDLDEAEAGRRRPLRPVADDDVITGDPVRGGFVRNPRADLRPPATIAAPYCGPPPEECCYVFQWAGRQSGHPDPDWRLEMIPREMAAIRTGIGEVAALPTGLILYDMRVFDVLPPPWFDYEWTDEFRSQKASTEDVYQTRNASMLGLPQYCAWDCWAAHVKDKHVGKPVIVTRDQVHDSLRQAVLRGVDRGDQLVMLKDGPFVYDESKRHDDALRMVEVEHWINPATGEIIERCKQVVDGLAADFERRYQSIPRSPEGLADADLESYYPSGGDNDLRTDGS